MIGNERKSMAVLVLMEEICGRLIKRLPYGEEQTRYRHVRSSVRWLCTELMMKDAKDVLEHVCSSCDTSLMIQELGKIICDQWADFEETGEVTAEMVAVTDACYFKIRELYHTLKRNGCICVALN